MSDLPELLEELRERVLGGRSSIYAEKDEVLAMVERAIRFTGEGHPELADLPALLAPTSALQDFSIDNGWGQRFLEIAAAIEAATKTD